MHPSSPKRSSVERAIAALVAAMVAIAALSAGHGYLWCVPMQRAMSACCKGPRAHDDLATAGIESVCCERREVPSAPASELRRADAKVPPATLHPVDDVSSNRAAWQPRASAPALVRAQVRDAVIRAGPATAPERCANLCVYRC